MGSNKGWIVGFSKTTELWDPTMVGMERTCRIVEPRDPTMVGVEGTLTTITPRDPTRVGVERTFRIMALWDPTRFGFKDHTTMRSYSGWVGRNL